MGIKKFFLYFALSLCLIISIGCTPNLSIDIPTAPVSIPIITTAILTNTSQPTLPPNLPISTSQPTSTNQPTGNLQVHFVDVGQGDTELVITPHGNTILIDGGEKGSGIIAYLAKVGIKKIDIMVATHPHSDHIGGLVEVLNSIPVAEVITTGASNTTDLFMDFLTGIETAKTQYVEMSRGETFTIDGITFTAIYPPNSFTSDDLNQTSLVLRTTFDNVTWVQL